MGFPPDRPASVKTIEEFIENHSNIFARNIHIRHINKVLRERNADKISVELMKMKIKRNKNKMM